MAVAFAAVVAVQPLAVAQASSAIDISDEDIDQITERLDRYDVPDEQQEALLDTLVNDGELWLSMTGGEAVDVETRGAGGATEVIQRFADGSVLVTGTEEPTEISNQFSPQAITGCTALGVGGGSTSYTGCKVYVEAVIVNAHFFADWISTTGTGEGAQINDVRPGQISTLPGTWSNDTLTIPKPSWDASAPARARLSFNVSLPSEAGMYSAWLEAYVWPTRHSSDSNFHDIVE